MGLVLRTGRQPRLRAWAYDVRAHTVFLEFGGDRQRQPVDPALAGWIAGPAVVAQECERAGGDDGSGALRDHVRRSGTASLEHRAEMGVEQVAELGAGDF